MCPALFQSLIYFPSYPFCHEVALYSLFFSYFCQRLLFFSQKAALIFLLVHVVVDELSLSFFFFFAWNIFTLPSLLKNVSVGHRLPGWWLFLFSILQMPIHGVLASFLFLEKSARSGYCYLIEGSIFFPLVTFNNFFLPQAFFVLSMAWLFNQFWKSFDCYLCRYSLFPVLSFLYFESPHWTFLPCPMCLLGSSVFWTFSSNFCLDFFFFLLDLSSSSLILSSSVFILMLSPQVEFLISTAIFFSLEFVLILWKFPICQVCVWKVDMCIR